MPTYEYKCNKCGHEFEIFQSIKDSPLKKCPECGKNSLKKLISGGAGLIFKGSGFYLTDYKSKPKEHKSEISPTTSSDKKEPTSKNKTDKKK